MNKTDNYQLNQWEGTDRILRTDFNADNLKTDDAVAELQTDVDALTSKAGAQLLKTISVTGKNPSADLSSIDWNEWKAVHMSFESSTESSCVITVKFNGNTVGIISGNYDTYFDDHRNFLHLLFYPLFDDRRRICNLALGHSSIDHYYCNSPYRNFTQLDFSCSNSLSLLSGSTLKIWGEK